MSPFPPSASRTARRTQHRGVRRRVNATRGRVDTHACSVVATNTTREPHERENESGIPCRADELLVWSGGCSHTHTSFCLWFTVADGRPSFGRREIKGTRPTSGTMAEGAAEEARDSVPLRELSACVSPRSSACGHLRCVLDHLEDRGNRAAILRTCEALRHPARP